MAVRHVVTWKVKGETSEERNETAVVLADALRGLVGVVPQIQDLSVSANSVGPEDNWDLVLIADFASESDLDDYQLHPAHLEVAGMIRAAATQRACVDYEL